MTDTPTTDFGTDAEEEYEAGTPPHVHPLDLSGASIGEANTTTTGALQQKNCNAFHCSST